MSHKPQHGMKGTKFYGVWHAMSTRCNNPNFVYYAMYGGRGIKRCTRWDTFENFRDDMIKSYNNQIKIHGKTTLERVDNDRGYSKENCRWATRKEQARNRRSAKLLKYKGQVRSVTEWAELLGINRFCIFSRLKRGLSADMALSSK